MNAITRHNYEEYFILYLDNELNAEDRRNVEAFVQLHPDLQDELELLLQSKLEPDTSISYSGKEELLFGNNGNDINLSNYDEWLTLYVDNELQPEQRTAVEQLAAHHPVVANDLYILQQTKLPVEEIVFPDKESLYRREEKVRRMAWWKIAAAAAIILGIVGTIVVASNKSGKKDGDTIANTNGQPNKIVPVDNDKKNDQQPEQQPVPVVVQQQPLADNSGKQKKEQDRINTDVANARSKKNDKQPLKKIIEDEKVDDDKKLPDENNDQYVKMDDHINARSGDYDTYVTAEKPLTNTPLNATPSGVTTAVYNPYNNQTTPPVEDVTIGDKPGRRNKLRGFLRKVTRTFEKTTNISATDDDDRLLVGGLAIRLK
jgi:hypothetical protein